MVIHKNKRELEKHQKRKQEQKDKKWKYGKWREDVDQWREEANQEIQKKKNKNLNKYIK